MGRRLAHRGIIWRHARVRPLLPCSYSTPLDLRSGLLPWRQSTTSGRRWRWRHGGVRWIQGRGDGRAPRAGGLGEPGKEEVCL